jgi:hypothetical protein
VLTVCTFSFPPPRPIVGQWIHQFLSLLGQKHLHFADTQIPPSYDKYAAFALTDSLLFIQGDGALTTRHHSDT